MRFSDTNWPRDALPKGTHLHGYTIDGVIGRGGFGITYRVFDAIEQVFAIKECFPRQFAVRQGVDVFPNDASEAEPLADCLSRFTKEAKALRQLSALGTAGDSIVKVVTFFQTNNTAYLVMEHVGGQSLDVLIKASPGGIEAAKLMDMLPALLHAVGCVHDAGLLHRDIKPANILLREDGKPVLIDFGATRGMSHGQTVTFTQIYSESYTPIEQFAGTKQGPYSDIYALGATLYKAIGGTSVDAFTRHQAVLRGDKDPKTPAAEIGRGRYDPRLLKMIDAAMRVAPEDRPQSVAALRTLLRGEDADRTSLQEPARKAANSEAPTFVADANARVTTAPPQTRDKSAALSVNEIEPERLPQRSRPKSRRAQRAAAAALLLLLMTAGGVFLVRQQVVEVQQQPSAAEAEAARQATLAETERQQAAVAEAAQAAQQQEAAVQAAAREQAAREAEALRQQQAVLQAEEARQAARRQETTKQAAAEGAEAASKQRAAADAARVVELNRLAAQELALREAAQRAAAAQKDAPYATQRAFVPADFENVLGLTRSSTVEDAVRLFGAYDTKTDLREPPPSFGWPSGLYFRPGVEVHVLCFGPIRTPFHILCSVSEARRRELMANFVRNGALDYELKDGKLWILLTDAAGSVSWR